MAAKRAESSNAPESSKASGSPEESESPKASQSSDLPESLKARFVLERLVDRARILVGDPGRVKGFFFDNDDFRRAPYFEAQARIDQDPKLLERLMAVYAKKYPEEFASEWEPKMRSGFASGERVIVRYAALGA